MGRRGSGPEALETFSLQEVHAAVKDALRLGGFDAVTPCAQALELYHLPRVVSTTSAGDYMTLLSGRAASDRSTAIGTPSASCPAS